MNYKSIILNKLLDKYEVSKSLIQDSNRRIILKLENLKEYDIENYETKKLFHDVVFDLEKSGLIFYSWKNHEKDNILKEIWLNKDNIKEVYSQAGRTEITKTNSELMELLENIQYKQNWIEEYRKDMINYLKLKHKPNSLFPPKFAKDILKVLQVIDNLDENLKRVLSMKCFGDSKYFEKNIEHIIIRIVKKYLLDLKEDSEEEYTNDEILLQVRNYKIS